MSGRKKAGFGSDHRRVEVKPSASAPSRGATIEEIKRWMREHDEPSIEVLLTRPLDALLMSAHVAAKLEQIPEAHATSITTALSHLKLNGSIAVMNRLCNMALNGRKSGLFKMGTAKRKVRARA